MQIKRPAIVNDASKGSLHNQMKMKPGMKGGMVLGKHNDE